jgi:isoleucyl-tRNA synthetase
MIENTIFAHLKNGFLLMRYKEYSKLDLIAIAQEVLESWEKNDVFNKSVQSRQGNDEFVFYEGPPSANGMPGIHHAMGRTIKDLFCRYQTLKGKRVLRKAGWDTHGLPVELGVEKELGITKEDIGKKISIEEYNDACKKAVMKYTDVWNELTRRLGYWVDMKDPYITYKSKYMESVWWLLKRLYDNDMLYKGYTIQPYSPKAGTGLSTHELNQPGAYRDVKDTTCVAIFQVAKESREQLQALIDQGKQLNENTGLLAWTTTPWTLPSNTALAVGKNINYLIVNAVNRYTDKKMTVVLAEALLEKHFNADKEDFEIIGRCTGAELLNLRYEQLLPYVLPMKDADQAFRVIPGEFVTTEDGTGIVHIAPTFGADDAKVANEAGVPPMLIDDGNGNAVPLVDLQGRFVPQMGELGGMYVKNEYYADDEMPEKSVDVLIAIKLKEEGKAFKVEKYEHSYPHCWRTDKPVLYYPLDSWFIRATAKKERMAELNRTINWKPASTGTGRFGNWLENLNDWNLSRSRFWGTPIPIWSTESGDEHKCIGSVEELKKECQKSVEKGFMKTNPLSNFESGNMSEENYDRVDLHKHIVDDIILVSEKGEPMKREADLIDVWFDSGAMPYAQWHYPFENKEMVDESIAYPADFIAEGVDQTRGWFYTLHAIATLCFDSVAYKNVVSNGLVLDKNGQKMSKRLGNTIDPFNTMDKYGPDATRWYMITNAQPWDNLRFDLEGIVEVQRKFFGTLYNTYSFFALYANVDEFSFKEENIPVSERPEIDRWIISGLHSLLLKVDQAYKEYEPTRAGRLIQDFVVNQLSNWYVRLCRRRFWKGDYSHDKIAA